MRVLRARAQRLAARRRHDDGVLPYDAESHHDQPPSSAASPDDAPSHRGRDTAMVVDLDLDDSDGRMAASSPRTLQPRPQEAWPLTDIPLTDCDVSSWCERVVFSVIVTLTFVVIASCLLGVIVLNADYYSFISGWQLPVWKPQRKLKCSKQLHRYVPSKATKLQVSRWFCSIFRSVSNMCCFSSTHPRFLPCNAYCAC